MNQLSDSIFIQRPHAIEQFRERAGYDKHIHANLIEEILRKEATAQIADGKRLRSKSERDTEFVVRLAIPDKNVVYALVEHGSKEGQYKYLIHTVFTKAMYDRWNEDGKLGSIGDALTGGILKELKAVKKEAPEKYLLRWSEPDGRWDSRWITAEEVQKTVLTLLNDGVPFDSIGLFIRVDFDISIKIGEEK